MSRRVEEYARAHLSLDHLRPGQGEVADAILAGRDALAVMPTGWGKSAIYQLAGELRDGTTVVVSPLIALEEDQLASMAADDVGPATALHSLQSGSRRRRTIEALADGRLQFVLLAPEQLTMPETLQALADSKPSLLVVDEAHCISAWGHGFRPDYLLLGAAAEDLGRPPVLALTATASPAVRAEIVERLALRDPYVWTRSADRPNIRLEVATVDDRSAAVDAAVDGALATPDSGIVYTATRARAEAVASRVAAAGRTAVAYHGGASRHQREAAEDEFLSGKADVLAGTSAFGLGVDRDDVRFVIHADGPPTLDEYLQEVGRAGRDGKPALARLLWPRGGRPAAELGAHAAVVTADDIHRIGAVLDDRAPADLDELQATADVPRTATVLVATGLHRHGVLRLHADGRIEALDRSDLAVALEDVAREAEHRRALDRSRVEMLIEYAETHACRRQQLLGYFGEQAPEHCGNCDRCDEADDASPEGPEGKVDADLAPEVAEQRRVRHHDFGEGRVLRRDGDVVTVLFDDAGYRRLSLRLLQAQPLTVLDEP